MELPEQLISGDVRVMYRTWIEIIGTIVGTTSFAKRPSIAIIRTIEF